MNNATPFLFGSLASMPVLLLLLSQRWVKERPAAVALLIMLLIGAGLALLMAVCVLLAVGHLP
jgi:hypothetical protein